MPWIMLPYGSDCDKAGKDFGVKGIPNLTLVNGDGTAADKDARSSITKGSPASVVEGWSKKVKVVKMFGG